MTTRPNTPTLGAAIRAAIDARLVDLHTALPAQVERYDAATQRVDVQPLIKRGYLDESGERAVERLPVITEVPVVFPGAGGFRVTFPIQRGDTVLVVFSEASLDRWLALGGEVDPEDERRHTLTDAIAIPGLRSFATPLSSAPTNVMTAGRDDGPVIEFDTSEIRAGGSQALALKSDVQAIVDAIAGGTPVAQDGGANLQTTILAALVGYPVGTSTLKGA